MPVVRWELTDLCVPAEEQGFVEFNEVRYTTPFVAREPKPRVNFEDDGILIRLDE